MRKIVNLQSSSAVENRFSPEKEKTSNDFQLHNHDLRENEYISLQILTTCLGGLLRNLSRFSGEIRIISRFTD